MHQAVPEDAVGYANEANWDCTNLAGAEPVTHRLCRSWLAHARRLSTEIEAPELKRWGHSDPVPSV